MVQSSVMDPSVKYYLKVNGEENNITMTFFIDEQLEFSLLSRILSLRAGGHASFWSLVDKSEFLRLYVQEVRGGSPAMEGQLKIWRAKNMQLVNGNSCRYRENGFRSRAGALLRCGIIIRSISRPIL
jgi:lysyl-tRNA synthetase class II